MTLPGRISAPLFLFAMAEGFSHIHDRKAYLKRLYIASVLMSVGNDLINSYLPHPNGAMVINGMFATLFIVGLYMEKNSPARICACGSGQNPCMIKRP
ncbi:TraX family protein [Blautia pseudococcoides]|uniref:TraX family protein n=1 Tax=Blautia pseudococcoides TaxID=1796616 RepID=UPI002598C690|nr:TraX family protein [uncultured Blautia sp.]